MIARRQTIRLALLGVSVLAAVATGSTPSHASTWSSIAQPSSPTVVPNASGSSISCGSSTCLAVGNSTLASGNSSPFESLWSNPKWETLGLGKPVGAEAAHISAVGCSIKINCQAVGNYTDSTNNKHLYVKIPLGSARGALITGSAPEPKQSKNASFSGLDCEQEINFCEIVGSYNNVSGVQVPLVEQWNSATGYAILEPTIPKEAKATDLSGVGCTLKIVSCVVVGNYTNGSSVQTLLAERWNGQQWTIQAPVTPKGAKASAFSAIGCNTTKLTTGCEAVGTYTNSLGNQAPFAEQLKAEVWSLEEPAIPKEAKNVTFTSIGCTVKLTRCEVVGNYTSSAGTKLLLAEQWKGGSWGLQQPAVPVGSEASSLSSVSCDQIEECFATGQTTIAGVESPLTEILVGNTWTITSLTAPSVAPNSSPSALSCVSATACFSVGNYTTTLGNSTAIAHTWNGTAWTLHEPLVPKGAKMTRALGVACASVALKPCVEVGSYVQSTGTEALLAEEWNGSEWAIQEPLSPKEGKNASLVSIGCELKIGTCEAVGSYVSSGGEKTPLIEQWKSGKWSLQSSAEAKNGSLMSVSCAPNGEQPYCEAVGNYTNGGGEKIPLVERLLNNEWLLQTTPKFLFSEDAKLNGVSCVSSNECVSVGSYTAIEGLGKLRVAERWDGSKWFTQEIPDMEVGEDGEFTGVSCAVSQACSAVGSKNSSILAERRHGEEWNGQALRGAGENRILTVSCGSVVACIATGAQKVEKIETPIAERYEETPEIIVKPSTVKFGNVMSGERSIEYTNNGPIVPWTVPSLVYTVTKGSKEAVTIENSCSEQEIIIGAKCNVVLKYKVLTPETYLATIKITPAPTVTVEAEA